MTEWDAMLARNKAYFGTSGFHDLRFATTTLPSVPAEQKTYKTKDKPKKGKKR